MTSGGQCVMTPGTALMLLWSAGSWDMHTLEVSISALCYSVAQLIFLFLSFFASMYVQLAGHTAMPALVLAVETFSWMMSSVAQVLASY